MRRLIQGLFDQRIRLWKFSLAEVGLGIQTQVAPDRQKAWEYPLAWYSQALEEAIERRLVDRLAERFTR
jgi:hypothetical protein